MLSASLSDLSWKLCDHFFSHVDASLNSNDEQTLELFEKTRKIESVCEEILV